MTVKHIFLTVRSPFPIWHMNIMSLKTVSLSVFSSSKLFKIMVRKWIPWPLKSSLLPQLTWLHHCFSLFSSLNSSMQYHSDLFRNHSQVIEILRVIFKLSKVSEDRELISFQCGQFLRVWIGAWASGINLAPAHRELYSPAGCFVERNLENVRERVNAQILQTQNKYSGGTRHLLTEHRTPCGILQ